MAPYDARWARLERIAHGQPATLEAYVHFTPKEFLEAAIEAAEHETGLKILEIDPFTLEAKTWSRLAMAVLEAGVEITR